MLLRNEKTDNSNATQNSIQNSIQNLGLAESSSPCSTCMLRKNCIISRSKNDTDEKSLHLAHRSLLIKSNQHLYFNSDKLESVYVVKSGSFKSYLVNSKGDEQIIEFHLPGDILGLDALSTHQFESSAVALETSSVCAIPSSQLEHLIERQVPDWIMDLLMGKLMQQQRSLSALGKKNAKRRIATFILDLSENYQALGYSGKSMKINMSRHDIGNYLGTRVRNN